MVDRARRKLALRHGGEFQRIHDFKFDDVAEGSEDQTLIIHDLIDHLAGKYPRQAEVAKLRLFLQLTYTCQAVEFCQ